MANVTATQTSLTITISDPVELERVLTVLKRSNSTKVAALRQEIANALIAAAITPGAVEDVLAGFDKLLEAEAPEAE